MSDWPQHPLSVFVKNKAGNSKIIKGKQSNVPLPGLVQGFSASGPDVWVSHAAFDCPGVVVSAVGARCGKTFLASGQWTPIANTHALVPGSEIDARWLWYRTNDEKFWIKGGSAQPFVKVKATLEQPQLIPPLSEQKRIVAILDEAFAAIDAATANAEKNLANARELFESHLNAIFSKPKNAWPERQLGEVCGFENGDRGKNYPSRSARTQSGIPFINAGHLNPEGISFDSMDYISPERFDLLSNGKIQPGDLLFCLRGSLGKFAPVGVLERGAIASSLVIVRPDSKRVLPEFVAAYFATDRCSEMIDLYKNGAAQPNLSARSLTKFVIPLPGLAEQEFVVSELDSLNQETQELGDLYTRKLDLLTGLRQSILQKAFTGELRVESPAASRAAEVAT